MQGTTGSKNSVLSDNVKDMGGDNSVLYIPVRLILREMLIYRAQLRRGNDRNQRYHYES